MSAVAAGRFVGQSVARREDPRLLTGRGCFVDDVVVPGMVHACFVRSDLARAAIRSVDTTAAAALPGVYAVLVAADLDGVLAGSMQPTMYADGALGPCAPLRPLARGDVRYVGEPIAIVLAESRYVAEDACELIAVDYEPLTPVVDFERAALDTENLVNPEWGSNVAMTLAGPDDPGVEAALAEAAHVVTETFWQQRQTNVPMEARGIVCRYDPASDELSVWVSSQNPHEVRLVCARITGVPPHRVRVIQRDVGGGFGQKYFLQREEMAVALAARATGRTIKWVEDRRENLTSATHARTDRATVTVGVDAEGRIVAARLDHLEDVGALPVGGTGAMGVAVASLFTGPYRVPRFSWRTTAVFTNTCGRGAYRGPWMFETVAREQMMDAVARAIGMDPLEFRRRNVLRRDELPYTTPTGVVIADVSPAETLEQAAELIGYESFRAEQAAGRAEGRHLGIGLSLYIEPSTGMGALGMESAIVRIDPGGVVHVAVGSGAHGQGIETTMAQVVADELGVDVDDVVVHQGDTAVAPFGGGTGGSRTAIVVGGAVRRAAAEARAKVAAIAAHMLEAAPEDIVIERGRAAVAGTPARSVSLAEVAAAAYLAPDRLPEGLAPGLEFAARHQAPPVTYSNACHACVCEVDVATGAVRLLRYVVSEDCGVMINPAIVEGQIAGGVAQGIGGALFEEVVYDGSGNPLTATFLDYLVPTADDVPPITYGHVETPSPALGGHKGMGEGGAIGAPAAVFNAVADALAPLGVRLRRTPLSPPALADALAASGVR